MSYLISEFGKFGPLKLDNSASYSVTGINQIDLAKIKPDGKNAKDHDNGIAQKISKFIKIKEQKYPLTIHAHARDVMTKNVVTLAKENLLFSARDIFEEKSFRHILIEDEQNNICGILSDRDLLKHKDKLNAPVKEVMSNTVYFVTESTTVQEIAHLMLSKNISCAPVANDKYRLVGIVTQSDLLRLIFKSHFF